MSQDKCTHEFLSPRKFCGKCGHPVPHKICHCGYLNSAEANYCEYCGSLLEMSRDKDFHSPDSFSVEKKVKYFLSQMLAEAIEDRNIVSQPVTKDECLNQTNIREVFKKKGRAKFIHEK